MAGAMERAGFIEAPVIGPANIASRPMTPPMAIPAVMPFSLAPVETLRITYIKIPVRMTSKKKDCQAGPAGKVEPRFPCSRNKTLNTPLARNAPTN